MKKVTFIILMICSSKIYSQTICEGQQVVPIETFNLCSSDPWILVFEDDFSGNSLDVSVWNPITGVPRDLDFGSQKAWHKPENVVVENGLLKIISKDEPQINMPVVTSWNPYTVKYEDFDYTSGEIWTKKKFLYGKFEARIKIPKGKGFWPAFWLFGGSVWNEIDIFEFWNEDNVWGNYDPDKLSKVHHMNVWYDHNSDGNDDDCGTKYTGSDFSQDFHVFTVIWEKNKIEWYVDGNLKRTDYRYYTILGQTTGCTINAWGQYILNKIYPKEPMSIILNTAIQTGSDSPDNSTPFPSQMEVDWVRCYQRNAVQDINITDANQYPLDGQIFNVIVGDNVNINCNYTIPSGQQLEIVAKNSVTLGPGFNAELGSTFSAKVDPTLGGSSLKSASINNTQDTLAAINHLEKKMTDTPISDSDIRLFPNPNEGSFIVDFGSIDYKLFSIVITNVEGKFIDSFKDLSSSTIEIDLSGNTKGVYILYLLNNQEKKSTTHKIILQ